MSDNETKPEPNAFEAEAEQADPGFFAEFWDFIRHNKKWWLTPIIVIILLMAGAIMLGPAAPFIYPLF